MVTQPELTLEAELAGDERAIRHLIGERAALASRIKRRQAHEQLLKTQLRHLRTPRAVGSGPVPSGLRFPDVSSFQPNVSWSAVRHAGQLRVGELAFVKLTEGVGWTDPFAAGRWRTMHELQFPHRGGYTFLHPQLSGVDQANHLLATIGGDVKATDILAADLEVSDGASARMVQQCAIDFGHTLRQHTPAKVWLYTGGPFAHEFGLTLTNYDAHWLPAYVGDPTPFMVFGRHRTIAWQYTDGRLGPVPHACPGIGAGDMSIVL